MSPDFTRMVKDKEEAHSKERLIYSTGLYIINRYNGYTSFIMQVL
jgi:hypothetical protein